MELNNENTRTFDLAEISISYQPLVKPADRLRITGSQDAEKILRSTWNIDTMELLEEFKILLMNRANRVLGIYNVSKGGTVGTVADPKVIFATALKAAACGIILSHNHPSGNLTPSQADIDLTRKLKAGGKLLEIQVLDHIILTSEKYYSFADEGLM